MFVLPIVFICISMISSFEGSKATIGILDKDNTKFTQIFINNLKVNNNIVNIKEVDIKNKLINSNVDYVIEIDHGFTSNLLNNKNPMINSYSIKESNASLPIKYYIESFLSSSKNISTAANGDSAKFYSGIESYLKGSFGAEYTDVKDTGNKKGNTVAALGFLIMSMIFLTNNSATLILDDKKNKTFYRIFASPISARNYMLQNVLSFFVILIIQLVLIFGIMKLGFKADFGPSIFNVFALFSLFALLCVSLGVAIASISKDSRQAGALSTFITVPMCMLGGCFWPRSFMPDVLLKISNFMPTTWVLKAADKVIRGAALSSVLTEIGVLLLFTLVFILLGSWKKADITK